MFTLIFDDTGGADSEELFVPSNLLMENVGLGAKPVGLAERNRDGEFGRFRIERGWRISSAIGGNPCAIIAC
jgi:hypothetical protein